MNCKRRNMSTQVETRLPSSRPRRSLLPGPKASSCHDKTARSRSLPSASSPSSGFKHLLLGQEVTTSDGKTGVLRFKGKTHFTQGYLCGIELYNGNGKNDGSVDGIHYFECVPSHGLFVPAYKVFPLGPPLLNGEVQSCKTVVSDVKAHRKLHTTATVTSKRLPRPKTLPFSNGALQKDRQSKSAKSGNTQISCYSVKVSSSGAKEKRSSSSSSKLLNRKVSPLDKSLTCPAWLGKDALKSPNSRFSQVSQKEFGGLNNTFTLPGDDHSSLQSDHSAKRKNPKETGGKNGYQLWQVMPETECSGRLDSVPSYQNLSSIGGSEEELLDIPTRPDLVENCHLRANRTYDVTNDPAEIGSQGSLGTCEKSNSSLAWDFDIPTSSTPVEFHVRVGTDVEDALSEDDEIEYDEFLAIPSSLDTPTGRWKFDLLTPEELEQALSESNLIPENLREELHDDELYLKFMDIKNTPIWEPITPVEEEFFVGESTLHSNPLSFWSMDSVPVKGDVATDQDPVQTAEEGADMEFTNHTTITLENGVSLADHHNDESIPADSTTRVSTETNGIDPKVTVKLSPVDLLEGVNDGNHTFALQNGLDERGEGKEIAPTTVEVMVDGKWQRMEHSDSSSCSNRTVMENLNGLEKAVESATIDLTSAAAAVTVKETVGEQENNKTVRKSETDSSLSALKRKSLLIKPKTGVKPNTAKSNVKVDISVAKEKKTVKGVGSHKPPVPPKLSVIPRRKAQDPVKATAKLTEVKSRINTGRKVSDDAGKEKETTKSKESSTKKEVKVKRVTRKSTSSSPGGSPASGSNSSLGTKRPPSRKSTNPPPSGTKRLSRKTNSPPSRSNPPSRGNLPPGNVSNVSVGKRKKENVTNVDAAPTRRAGFAVPAARKQSLNEANDKKLILPKDQKQTKKIQKKPKAQSSTPPDIVHTSIPNEQLKLLEAHSKQFDEACKQISINAKAFEAMAVLVQYLTQQYDAFSVPDLKKKIKCMEVTVKDMSVQISTNEKEITRLREEHVENNRCHAMQTEEMLKEHQVEVDSLSKELRNQTLSNQELQKEYDALEQLKEEADKQHQQETLEMECRTEQVITKLNGDAKLREQVLEDEKFELKCKCDTLEDALKTDTKVQAAIAQLKHLPEEVESLKTVLAMKNQEVQEMRIKMVDLEKQVAEIPAKDDKIKQLQAKVEDLSAMVECKIVYERQLSSEQVTLRENFEKETNANKRLSMEKEELIWRLNQNQTGQSAISPGRFTPPKFNPSHIPSSPLTSRTLLSRASSSESHESGVFSPNNPPQQ
ncbi:uncharacterized protein [Apostichopus japonicus]|uniref:uncharacterized protein isoform X3 n=2 Tax=Stichopus japonicus TaxID=307972 RepID=UPI003AB545EF